MKDSVTTEWWDGNKEVELKQPAITVSPIFSKQEVSEILEAIHYPEHWDTACYPTLADAIYEIVTNAGCSECRKQ